MRLRNLPDHVDSEHAASREQIGLAGNHGCARSLGWKVRALVSESVRRNCAVRHQEAQQRRGRIPRKLRGTHPAGVSPNHAREVSRKSGGGPILLQPIVERYSEVEQVRRLRQRLLRPLHSIREFESRRRHSAPAEPLDKRLPRP